MPYGPRRVSREVGERMRRRYESRTGRRYDDRLRARSAAFWCAATALILAVALAAAFGRALA